MTKAVELSELGELLTVNDGKVGIGTGDPERLLSLKGVSPSIKIEASGGNGRQWTLYSTDDTTGPAASQNPGDFVVYDDTNGIDRLVVQGSSGNIGIGTDVPNQRLTVDHDGHGVGFGYVSSIPDAPGGVYSTAGNSTYPFNEYGNLILKSRTDYSVYDIIMMTASTNGNAEIRMVIKDNGRVGVGGITDPVQDFEVEGSIGTNQVRHSIRPTLNLDFANSKELDPRITFYRDSIATYYDSKGVLRYSNVNEPRFDHNPVTGESKGLLIEEARTNYVTFDPTNYNTVGSNAPLKFNVEMSPNDKFDAHLITGSGQDVRHSLHLGQQGYPLNSEMALSIYVKPYGNHRYVSLESASYSNWTTVGTRRFDLVTKTAIDPNSKLEEVGNG